MLPPSSMHPPAPLHATDGDGHRMTEAELVAIIGRAALLGVPAWRVTTALGLRTL